MILTDTHHCDGSLIMTVKLKLKNREGKFVTINSSVMASIEADPHLKKHNMLGNLRAHSSGYAFFQRWYDTEQGPKCETIYLHKYIGEKYISKPKTDKKLYLRFKDGNVLNATIENLEWTDMTTLRRNMKTTSRTGYRGVTASGNGYIAVIMNGKVAIRIGRYDTPQEAAKAYNEKSIELFGITDGLNKL